METKLRHARRLLAFIFGATRISIARSWNSLAIPFDLVKTKLSWIMVNERLSTILLDKQVWFDKIWEPWIKYLLDAL